MGMALERRRVLYEGRVQGVGFRMTTNRLAKGFAVSGSVRNLVDGRVEVVAQAEHDVLVAFLAAIGREFGDLIRSATSENLAVDPGAPPSFAIHYNHDPTP